LSKKLNKKYVKEREKVKKYIIIKVITILLTIPPAVTTIVLELCPTWLPVRAFKGYLTVRAANVCPVNISQWKFLAFPFCVSVHDRRDRTEQKRAFLWQYRSGPYCRHVAYGNNTSFVSIIW